MIYYEPVHLKHWNMFKEVPGPGHVESFYGVKDMSLGDIVLLHVGSQDGRYESGIYAFGEVVGDPYLDNDPKDLRYGKYRIDVKFNTIVRNKPLMSHEQCKKYITQFRTVHKINEIWYDELMRAFKIK